MDDDTAAFVIIVILLAIIGLAVYSFSKNFVVETKTWKQSNKTSTETIQRNTNAQQTLLLPFLLERHSCFSRSSLDSLC
jgi:hypothetical protein